MPQNKHSSRSPIIANGEEWVRTSEDAEPAPVAAAPARSLLKGRGAVSAPLHRFAKEQREWLDDGWNGAVAQGVGMDAEEHDASHDEAIWWRQAAQALGTQVHEERARSAIQKNDSPDIFFDHSVNPYRGCEHEI
ncbi:hypothetical protein ACFIQG_19750 [Comamonas odontotermitis]|uniref:hypothetical protein n=1 Tax=Comamonas odontotermitis TaxID=379895 RepID=UPI0036701872